jgi:prevent-host-death family protein
MDNILTVAELKRRGMAAIEEGLKQGPVRIVKRNRSAAVVLSEDDYRRLTGGQPDNVRGLSALQWLLMAPSSGTRSKQEIDRELADERGW